MQADRFTVKSQEAVAAAQELARTRNNPEIASAHLLLALLDQAESMAVAVLQRGSGGSPPPRRRCERGLATRSESCRPSAAAKSRGCRPTLRA
jgi:ATP-dependent Clp protease ATP-binding subunit ClpB